MLAEKPTELQANSAAHTMFQAMTLLQFWTKQSVAYLNLAKAAWHCLIPLPKTFLCESGFLALVDIQTKKRMRLDPSCQMCLSVSKIKPKIM